MPHATKYEQEGLESLEAALAALAIQQSLSERPTGSDLPDDARMIITPGKGIATDQTIEFHQPHAHEPAVILPIHRPTAGKGRYVKAVAVLVTGPKDPLWASVSGWTAPRSIPDDQLNAAACLPRVRQMCEEIGHSLAVDFRDKKQAGRYHACHAEKQLLAHLYEQRAARKHARIHINHAPCADCQRCVKAFVLATGITVTMFVHGEHDSMTGAAALLKPTAIRFQRDGSVKVSI